MSSAAGSVKAANWPLIYIDSVYLVEWDVAEQRAVILGMGRSRQGQSGLRRVGNEEFLAGDADALAAVLAVDLGHLGLQPGRCSDRTVATIRVPGQSRRGLSFPRQSSRPSVYSFDIPSL